jgi:TolB protein
METKRLSTEDSLERLPVPIGSGQKIIYIKKEGFSYDSIELFDTEKGTSQPLASENFTSQTAFTLAPDQNTLAYTWPNGDDYEIRLLDVAIPVSNLLLTKSEGLPLYPKFSADGQWIYYAEYDKNERSQLKRISINGGSPETIQVKNWNWGTATERIKISSFIDGKQEPVRLNIVDSQGHPLIPDSGAIRSEGQHGMVFFYSPGTIEIEAPIGDITLTAVQGFSTTKAVQKIGVQKGISEVKLELNRIWDANAHGWYSGDNHFHLNYGGTHQLDPEDIVLDINAEDLDIAFPLVANLGNRFLEQDLMGWKNEGTPIIQFGQEVRSHFLGHLGLIGTKDAFWPWVWGPYYDVYGADDRLNSEALRFAHEQNALGGYVHPVSIRNPFEENGRRRVPISLIADAVLGEADYLELACLWTDEIGTGAVWHALLNTGIPLGISAGSDVMNDLYRTMAIGATRVYVKPKGPLTVSSYLEAIKSGKSFATNGPLLQFSVGDKDIGEVIQTKRNRVAWNLTVHSPVPYDKIEIFVNGKVVATQTSNQKMGSENFKGHVKIPAGGWITARVSGGATTWPVLDSYPFAESSPIWYHYRGSTDTYAAQQSAVELLKVLEVSTSRLKLGYGNNTIPKLSAHFERAKEKLERIIENNKK